MADEKSTAWQSGKADQAMRVLFHDCYPGGYLIHDFNKTGVSIAGFYDQAALGSYIWRSPDVLLDKALQSWKFKQTDHTMDDSWIFIAEKDVPAEIRMKLLLLT